MIEKFKTLMREHFPEFPINVCGEWEFTDPTVNAMWLMYQICNAWQPIETAPKDGEPILIYKPDERMVGPYTMAAYFDDEQGGFVPVGGIHKQGYFSKHAGINQGFPTHWRPLPTPPLTTEGGV